ncbi:MAG TPA: triose-phosphate isomerase [Candidatus Woesebacteria bacterium]|nr:triose-phosphate isomerase [Candidatus Woesebacteria bacterium]HNS64874.1 triose-phosphate isomerase [Candidatus Woesebacteria bacterium]
MQKKILIANWKSHKTKSEVDHWFSTLEKNYAEEKDVFDNLTIIIAPSVLYLELGVNWSAKIPGISIAAQDVSQFPLGAYTGAVAARQLASVGVSYAIVGHSERRKYFGETHQIVAQKIDQLLEAKLLPIVCVDEQEIMQQADFIPKDQAKQCIFAYEPVSAIGSGIGQDIPQVTASVKLAKQSFGEVPVLYGGSVDVRNIQEYLLVADGALIGGASLDVAIFSQLLSSTVSKNS